jgi:hypothetical protein
LPFLAASTSLRRYSTSGSTICAHEPSGHSQRPTHLGWPGWVALDAALPTRRQSRVIEQRRRTRQRSPTLNEAPSFLSLGAIRETLFAAHQLARPSSARGLQSPVCGQIRGVGIQGETGEVSRVSGARRFPEWMIGSKPRMLQRRGETESYKSSRAIRERWRA